MSTFRELETVVLRRDRPESGLRSGDLGTIVHAYGAEFLEVEFLEVEFMTAAGQTQALRRKTSAVPRQRELKDFLAKKICRDLEIPAP